MNEMISLLTLKHVKDANTSSQYVEQMKIKVTKTYLKHSLSLWGIITLQNTSNYLKPSCKC